MSITTVKRPSFTGALVSTDDGAVGDTGETVMSMKLKVVEAHSSSVVAEIPAGTQFQVVEVGSVPGRIRVTTSGNAGWISKSTEQGMPLVKWVRKKRNSMKDMGSLMERRTSNGSEGGAEKTQDGVSAGDVCETVLPMTLREGEDHKSKAVGQIPSGTQFEIVQVGAARRVKVIVPETVIEGGAVGWLSTHTDTGQVLCKIIKSGPKRRKSSLNISKNISIPIGQGEQKPKVEAQPPGLRRTLSPVPQPGPTAAPKPKKTEDDSEAKRAAAARADEIAAKRGAAHACKAAKPPSPWWKSMLCCSS